MVVLSPTSSSSTTTIMMMTKNTKRTKCVEIPTIDLSMERTELSKQVVRACEECGFFKVVNHCVPKGVVLRLEEKGDEFFAKPISEKNKAGPANPFGYGNKNIGPNGDMGDLEYLLLHTNPLTISRASKTISNDPAIFSNAVKDYTEANKELACEILNLVAEGLGIQNEFSLSKLIRDVHSDSLLRMNHYLPMMNLKENNETLDPSKLDSHSIGFGEHSDPQLLTILCSNDVGGLQISTHDGLWIPVPPDPNEFYAMVGDSLQVLTNGRFTSVRHRVLTEPLKKRKSMMYFAAPPLNWCIAPLPYMVTPNNPSLYKPFTWGHYKKTAYSLRLGATRLDLFKLHKYDDDDDGHQQPPYVSI